MLACYKNNMVLQLDKYILQLGCEILHNPVPKVGVVFHHVHIDVVLHIC